MADRDDDVLGKADALLGRHRSQPVRRPEPPVDFPVLTDVYSRPLPPLAPSPAPVPAPAAPPPAPMLSDAQLHEIERDLRLQLLQLMGPELERLVESRVHARMAPVISGIVERMRVDLENEIRRAVQDALNQVVEDEVARLQREDGA